MEHPSTLTSVNNLAGVLRYQGKYEKAKEMSRRALKVLGVEHPDTLTSVNNLAYLLQAQRQYEGHRSSIKELLKGFKRRSGLIIQPRLPVLKIIRQCLINSLKRI